MEASESNAGHYVNLIDDGKELTLKLAKRTFTKPSKKLKVTLLSAIHFAQAPLYKTHNQILSKANIVLYEGKGFDKPGLKWLKDHPETAIYERLQRDYLTATAYGLSIQAKEINYQQDHFVHADEPFSKVISNPKQHLVNIQQTIKSFNSIFENEALVYRFKNGFDYVVDQTIRDIQKTPLKLRLKDMVKGLENFKKTSKDISPAFYESEVIKRNAIVLQRLAEQMEIVDEDKEIEIVIYYGAAHMPCFEKELREKYGMTLESEEWLTAIVLEN